MVNNGNIVHTYYILQNFINYFQIHSKLENDKEANKMYDAIKEEGSIQILDYLI